VSWERARLQQASPFNQESDDDDQVAPDVAILAAVPTGLGPATFADLREVLGYRDGDRISICREPADKSDEFRGRVVELADADEEAAKYTAANDVWFGVCPTSLPAGSTARRGRADQITRLTAAWSDFDITGRRVQELRRHPRVHR
jgi:hypothetical protein